jgi:hypothetical protein
MAARQGHAGRRGSDACMLAGARRPQRGARRRRRGARRRARAPPPTWRVELHCRRGAVLRRALPLHRLLLVRPLHRLEGPRARRARRGGRRAAEQLRHRRGPGRRAARQLGRSTAGRAARRGTAPAAPASTRPPPPPPWAPPAWRSALRRLRHRGHQRWRVSRPGERGKPAWDRAGASGGAPNCGAGARARGASLEAPPNSSFISSSSSAMAAGGPAAALAVPVAGQRVYWRAAGASRLGGSPAGGVLGDGAGSGPAAGAGRVGERRNGRVDSGAAGLALGHQPRGVVVLGGAAAARGRLDRRITSAATPKPTLPRALACPARRLPRQAPA